MNIKNFKDDVIRIINQQIEEYTDKENKTDSNSEKYVYISQQWTLLFLKSQIIFLYNSKYDMKGGDK